MLQSAVPAAGESAWTAAGVFFEDLLKQFSDPLRAAGTTHEAAAARVVDEERIHCRCKVTLLMLRAAHAALINASHTMPVEARFRFIDSMSAAVHAAAAFNDDHSQRGLLINDIASTQSSEPGANNNARPGTSGDFQWDNPPLPALARQETEGGCLMIDALVKTSIGIDSSGSLQTTAGGDAYVLGCKERLILYCSEVMQAAVVRLSGTRSVLPWEDAVRGPVVEAALRALCAMPAEDWKAQRAMVFAGAAQLVRCRSMGVRRAVRELMQKQALQAATAAAGGVAR